MRVIGSIRIRGAPPENSWSHIEKLLAAGGEPKLSDLESAIKSGEPIPPRAAAFVATLIRKKSQRKRGRPNVPTGEHPLIYRTKNAYHRKLNDLALIYTVAELASKSEDDDPVPAAISKIATARNCEYSTIRRYYMKACARWPEAVKIANGK